MASNIVPTQDQNNTTNMNLHNAVTINGRRFEAGTNVEVPRNMADDVARIDYDAQKGKEKIFQGNTYNAGLGINPQTGLPFRG